MTDRPVYVSKQTREEEKQAAEAALEASERRRKEEIQRKIAAFQSQKKQRSRSPRPVPKSKPQVELKEVPKLSDKYRKAYQPEWDASEDTSQPSDIQIQPKFLFGKVHSNKLSSRSDQGPRDSWRTKDIREMTGRDWRIFREDHDIIIKGGTVPWPMRSWSDSDMPFNMLQAVQALHYEKPTPIQMQAIPCGLAAKDLLALAPTGSGKSAAFLIPMLAMIQTLPALEGEAATNGPYGLIMSPTRELALQIYTEAMKLAEFTRIRCLAMVGGHDIDMQSVSLSRGIELLVGTPGRIKDCLERQYLVLNQCTYIVIDEADKIILLEQDADLQFILDQLNPSSAKSSNPAEAKVQEESTSTGTARFRVTQLFSATMDPQIERIWRQYLRCPAYISIGQPGAGSANITQEVLLVSEGEKKGRLLKAVKRTRPPVLVFVNHKNAADNIVSFLRNYSYRAEALHGGKSQTLREGAMEEFRTGKVDVMVTTDLMSRGIDVENIKHVINYDAPNTITDYEHRIGRTGRAGATGLATTLLTLADEEIFADLRSFLLNNKQPVPEDLNTHPSAHRKEEAHISA